MQGQSLRFAIFCTVCEMIYFEPLLSSQALLDICACLYNITIEVFLLT